jgi:iron-sulfur cluster assembly accessory protein
MPEIFDPAIPVRFTDAAVAHLKQKIAEENNGTALRLSLKKYGCNGYAYVTDIVDVVPEGDVHYVVQNDLHITLKPDCLSFLRGTKVDYVEKELGLKKLEFMNPNVSGACGCGESFNMNDDLDVSDD